MWKDLFPIPSAPPVDEFLNLFFHAVGYKIQCQAMPTSLKSLVIQWRPNTVRVLLEWFESVRLFLSFDFSELGPFF